MFIDTTPLFFVVLALGVALMLFAPRHWLLPSFLAISVFVSFGPRVVILGQNFMTYRVLLFFLWARILMRGEHRGFVWQPLDKALVLYCLWTVVGDTLLWGTVHAMIYQIANQIYDTMGIYFLARILLNDAVAVRRLLVAIAVISVVLAGFMFMEWVTGRSWLNALGSFQEFVTVRKGRFRCQASFAVPITAGTYGAVLLPLFIAFWWQDRDLKKWAIPGCIAATIITVTSASGGPCMSYLAALGGLALWPFRRRMRSIRWAVVFGIIALQLVMKAPFWYIIDHIHVVAGDSAYHRAHIIDVFVRNFSDWWLLGVKSTNSWGWLMGDVANNYGVVAKHGGLLALVLFVRVLWVGFREVGRRCAEAAGDFQTEILLWAVGVMLFTHAVSFIGISYFDQMKVVWCVSLALVASAHLLLKPALEPAVAATAAAAETPRGFSAGAGEPAL